MSAYEANPRRHQQYTPGREQEDLPLIRTADAARSVLYQFDHGAVTV